LLNEPISELVHIRQSPQ